MSEIKNVYGYVLVLISLFCTIRANANALASIYNGDQYHLRGQFLVQDADHPNDFYILPQAYRLKHQSVYDEAAGDYKDDFGITHQVSVINNVRYSVYNMILVLEQPSEMQRMEATFLLRRKVGMNAIIKGIAPICGMRIAGFESASDSVEKGTSSPDATLIQYSIDSTEPGKCKSLVTATQFNIRIRVPLEQEPAFAANLISGVGVTLPSIELILPYKYKDHVTMTLNAHDALQQLKGSAGISGAFSVVSTQLKGSVEEMMNKLQIMGSLHVDCQNPDHSACDHFMQQAQEIITKIFFTYLPLSTQGDTNPIVLADKEKSGSAKVKVDLAIDSQTADHIGEFKLDFSNSVYDSVQTQAQIHVANVPKGILDPAVQALLKTDNN